MIPTRVIGIVLVSLLAGCTPVTSQPPSVDRPVSSAHPSSAARPPTVGAASTSASQRWRPTQGLSFDIQLSQQALESSTAAVLDLDGTDTSAATVAALKARGVRTICYLNAGGFENWRPDASSFPARVRGQALGDWPGENWLDIRELGVLMPIMDKRIQMCADKGFDAIDPDNLDGWQAASGFGLSEADAVAYERALIESGHRHGLAVGLKNATDLLPELGDEIDFAVNEQCAAYHECGAYAPLLASGKPVFHIEYDTESNSCAASLPAMSTVIKRHDLGPWVQRC
jgi:hypothetical protein